MNLTTQNHDGPLLRQEDVPNALREMSFAELQDEMTRLEMAMASIDAQLAIRGERDEYGRPVGDSDFWAWRQKAIFAKSKMTATLLLLRRSGRPRQEARAGEAVL